MVPTGSSFTAFNNEDPNGVWPPRAQDDIDGGGGHTAGGWALTIETRPVAAAVPGAGTEGIAAPYPVTRTVDMGDTVITDLNVEIDGIFHESPDDLDLLLVGPTGETVVLMSDACGTSDVAAYGWAWNDEALGTCWTAATPMSATPGPGAPRTTKRGNRGRRPRPSGRTARTWRRSTSPARTASGGCSPRMTRPAASDTSPVNSRST